MICDAVEQRIPAHQGLGLLGHVRLGDRVKGMAGRVGMKLLVMTEMKEQNAPQRSTGRWPYLTTKPPVMCNPTANPPQRCPKGPCPKCGKPACACSP